MNEGKSKQNAGRCPQSLTLQLAPALSEYLRREAGSRGIDPAELARRLLMRGLHSERFGNVARDLNSQTGPTISDEGHALARLEAGALLGALSDWHDGAPVGAGKSVAAGRLPRESAMSAMRAALERARSRRAG